MEETFCNALMHQVGQGLHEALTILFDQPLQRHLHLFIVPQGGHQAMPALRDEGKIGADHGVQTLYRVGVARGSIGHLLLQRGHLSIHHTPIDILLVAEIVIDGALGQPTGLGQFAHGKPRIPRHGNQPLGRVQDGRHG